MRVLQNAILARRAFFGCISMQCASMESARQSSTMHALLLLSLLAPPALRAPAEETRVALTSPAIGDTFAPRVVADGESVMLSWIEQEAATAPAPASSDAQPLFHLCMSRFAQGAWSPVTKIASSTEMFANWADTPTLLRASDGSLLATWLQRGALGGYVYDVMVSRSADDGKTWTKVGPLHDDGKPAEHGFVSAETHNGTTAFCWLDGRAMPAPDADSHDTHDHEEGHGDMSLRASRVAPTAARSSPPSEILDERTCECCPTDLAIASKGPIVVYRDRGDDGTRDISLVRWLGEGWSQPQPIGSDGWMMNGCPVNGPSISASENDVVVAWWTGATEHSAVRAARSKDGAATFGATIEIDADGSFGRVESLLLPSGDALILWHDKRRDGAALVARRLHADGSLGPIHTIDTVADSRSSGFPRAALQATDLWLTCTASGVGASRSVKVFRLPVDSLR